MKIFGRIEKVEEQDDGTIKVHGIASTESVDDQGETVLGSAIRASLPDYMKFPAVRSMHQLDAAGTTLEADVGVDNITRIVAHVVDPIAVLKVRKNVFRGFSIGGQVTARDAVNRTIITGIRLNEISLVDRPANPDAIYDCWKATTTIEGTDDMEPLATLGEMPAGEKLAAVAVMLEPVQVWACGIVDHQHAGKADAVKCLEAQAAEKASGTSDSADVVLEESTAAAEDPADGEKLAAADPGDAQTALEAAREAMERAKAALGEPGGTQEAETDAPPSVSEKAASISEFIDFLDALIDEEVSLSAIITSLHKTITDPEQLEALVSSVFEKGARHGATDQVHLDNAEYCCAKAMATKSASKTEKMDIWDAHKAVLDAGAASLSAPASRSAPDNATQDTGKAVLDAGATSIAAPPSAPPPPNATQDTGRNAQTQAPQTSAGKVPVSPMPKASDQELLEDAINKVGASIATLSKAGEQPGEIIEILASAEAMKKAGSPPHHILMDMAHRSLKAFSNGSTCKADAPDPERHTDMDMTRVHKAHYHLGRVGGGQCDADDDVAGRMPMARVGGENQDTPTSAKAITDDGLAKALADKTSENALLTKTLAEIVPLMTSMHKRIEQIAETPIAPRAMARIPATSISKAADSNGSADPAELSPAMVTAALAKMSAEEQTLTLIKATQRNPILVRSLSTAAEQRENFPAR